MAIVLAMAMVLTGSKTIIPEVAAMSIRLATIQDGMTETEVAKKLGLDRHLRLSGGATISHHSSTYLIGDSYTLSLTYSLKGRSRYELSEVEFVPARAK